MTSFIDSALHTVADGLEEFRLGLSDATSFTLLLERFGWQINPPLDAAAFSQVQTVFKAEVDALAKLRQPNPDYASLIPAIIKSLRSARTPAPSWPAPLNASAFWTDSASARSFPKDMLDAFIWNMLEVRAPSLFGLLRFGGVLRYQRMDVVAAVASAPARLAYDQRFVNWDQLGSLITEPGGALASAYQWNKQQNAFLVTDFLEGLGALFSGLPVSAGVFDASDSIYRHYYDVAAATSPKSVPQLSIIPFYLRWSGTGAQAQLKLSLNAVPIPPVGTKTGTPTGLSVFPLISGNVSDTLTVKNGVTITLAGHYASVPVIAQVRPNGLTFELPAGALTSIDAEARVDAEAKGGPWTVLGANSGPRIEVSKLHLRLKASGTLTDPVFEAELGVDKAALVIDFGEGDGFLQKIFGGTSQRVDLGLGFIWSNRDGFRLQGHAGLELEIPVHETLFGVLTVDTVFIGLGGGDAGGFELTAAMTASAEIGPITAAVKNVGLKFLFEPTNGHEGNLGLLDVALGFRSPDGAGLSLDTGAIVGAGYLERFPASGEYGGIVNLAFSELAIIGQGLIKPSAKDFSMVIIVSVTFSPPIQLSFGFTLSGVGGLVAVNRTVNVEYLRDGLKTGALEALLFPADPIANGPMILATMGAAFPTKQGRYVFGPIVRIGWGTPNLIIADIGIMLEVPEPIRIVLIGQISALLPKPDDAIVELHIDVLGVLDFEAKSLAIDATIYKSKILTYTLSGDAALRWLWGANAQFALSLGGFHPKFTPPPNFPSLRRLTLNLIDRSDLQIDCKVYQALTSNTLQFGASAELYASYSEASIEGGVSFDALIQIAPFHFEVDINGHVSAEAYGHTVASVKVSANLSGPTPWSVDGKASFSVLCWDPSVHFHHTWGRDSDADVPKIDPLPPLLDALALPEAWGAQFPENERPVEAIKAPEVASNGGDPKNKPVIVHPASDLQLLQSVLPLDFVMGRFGSGKPKDHNKVAITEVRVGGSVTTTKPVMGQFARAQFEDMSDADKVSRASFEDLTQGVDISPSVKAGTAAPAYTIAYEQKITLADGSSPQSQPGFKPGLGKHHPNDLQVIMDIIRSRRIRILPPGTRFGSGDPRVKVTELKYGVVDGTTLKPMAGFKDPMTFGAARAAMGKGGGPATMVPSFEMKP